MISFFNLIRYKNLIIIGGTQLLFKYFLINAFFRDTALLDWQFFILVFATVCIAAAGYVINDIQDIEIDKINKPKKRIVENNISEKPANYIYIILNITGVLIGFYISNTIEKTSFAILFVLISGALYFYATTLKKYILISNIIVSFLVAISILIIGIFDVLPIKTETNTFLVNYFFKMLLLYAIFAFFINLLREIIKDIQDINGDHKNDILTLPILIGKQRSSKLVAILSLFVAIALSYFIYTYLAAYQIVIMYFIFVLLAPILYVTFLCWEAKKKKEFIKLSMLLKIIMVVGVLSIIPIHYYILKGF